MTLPTFVTVGAEKCGTTALHAHLSHHPHIFMSEPKTPSFFLSTDQHYLEQDMGKLQHNYIDSLEKYQTIFSHVVDEKAIGETSPCYLYSKIAPLKIKELIPDAKIIAILRNPMKRAFSQYIFNQMRGWESRKHTFVQALDLEDERFTQNAMWAFHYRRRGMYSTQIKRYQKVFGARQVHVILYDDFVNQPETVLADIYRFLQIDNFKLENVHEQHNVTGLSKNKFLNQIISSPNLVKSTLKRLLPHTTRKWVMDKIRRLNTFKPKVNPADLLRLEKLFTPDIHKLSEIIQPDPLIWLNNDK